ncbi:hypothetical protein HNQ56_002717 [Anaerotaenia torta]|uniref:hypothetical protein n=1 Tax=Anaerotaenia torta TaxID=433293 RepID=UPI003D23F564
MDKILGIVYAYDVKDAYQELLDIGFSWVRMGICFPWKDKMFGTLSEEYYRCREDMEIAHKAGIQIMPSTPGMGGYRYDSKLQKTYYQDDWPDFVGEKGSKGYYENVAAACEFICRDLGEIAGDLWQCMNEIDIPTFSGNYSMEITTGTARASAEGIVRANPAAKCGINLSRYHEEGLKIADMVYAPGHKFGYIGDDQYFGSWQGKTVESWNEVIDALYERYHLPVVANEWGYSSGGAVKQVRPDASLLPEGIPDVCYEKSWFHEAEGGHTQEVQAEYLRRGLQIFAEHPHVLGSFLFCFKDAKHCYHCGEEDCPSECYWGITDVNGKPKKAYEAVKTAIKEYYQ